MSTSVTVSIGEDTMGTFSGMFLEKAPVVSGSVGFKLDFLGTISTSSYDKLRHSLAALSSAS
jgi:hypothetical protein